VIREIIIPKEKEYLLKLPVEYLNKRVEILVFSVDGDEQVVSSGNIVQKTSGILNNRSVDPLKWQADMRSQWGRLSKNGS